ncbi:MAG TPA: YkvA family protein [Xanthomonadales bacterium]|nr:YkvA family protein [Xanthomonadales bacterium]
MAIPITFELSETDIEYFREIMRRAMDRSGDLSKDEIIQNARSMLVEVRTSDCSDFIRQRMNQLETLIGMVVDRGWGLDEEDAHRVLQALSYFSEPEDLIPDHIPALGFLDDAIMVDLVSRELKHDIEAYRDFVVFRAAESNRLGEDAMKLGKSDWLEERRKQLHARMQRRRGGFGGKRSGGSGMSFF